MISIARTAGYGGVEGRVAYNSPSALLRPQRESFYKGMEASADILVDSKSLQTSYLQKYHTTVPPTASRGEEDQAYVNW